MSKPSAGIWQSSIRGAFGIEIEKNTLTPDEFIKGLLENNILFFDIIPVTLPFNTDIRTGWIDENKEIEAEEYNMGDMGEDYDEGNFIDYEPDEQGDYY